MAKTYRSWKFSRRKFQFPNNSEKAVIAILLATISIINSSNGQLVVNSTAENGYRTPVPYALSPTYLQFLADQEKTIHSTMKTYESELEERLKLVKRYTSDYERNVIKPIANVYKGKEAEIVASHPILAYQMLNRYANEFDAVGRQFSKKSEEAVSEAMFAAQGSYEFPSNSDAEDAMTSLLRMQYMYDLSAKDMANGELPGTSSFPLLNSHLTTKQCYKIAETAVNQDFYTLAVDWLDLVRQRLKNDTRDESLPFNDASVKQTLIEVITTHNDNFQELYEDGHEYLFSKKVRAVDGSKPISLRNVMVQNMAGRTRVDEGDSNFYQYVYANHISICNGANFQSEKEKSRLQCWLDRGRNPYFSISPLKVEKLSIKPDIIEIHRFMPQRWIEGLQNAAYRELERAPSGPHATPRTAAYSWYNDEELKEIPLSRRVEMVTGLNVVGPKAAEALQVAAYAFGGHVDLHFDSKGPEDALDPKGDRVTTFLIYLNDVPSHGITSFPKLGFGVQPEKGSAILWYTNMKNGGVDPRTLHGACPLMQGHKWIATKWTHSNENVFKRPCGLTPAE